MLNSRLKAREDALTSFGVGFLMGSLSGYRRESARAEKRISEGVMARNVTASGVSGLIDFIIIFAMITCDENQFNHLRDILV